jgi:hypothetical protein
LTTNLEKPQINAKPIIEALKQIKELANSDKSGNPITRQEFIYQIDVAMIYLAFDEATRDRLLTYLSIARKIAVKRTATVEALVPKIDAVIHTLGV